MTDDHFDIFGDYLESAEGVAEFIYEDDCLECLEDEWT